ncbi:MAG: hypothetical protein P0Y65_15720 [Candidatus Devosia phytovorans]|uniref:Uncharacterized protein n=1 Tax=Candidatus Devosia phytovorans TaxID=3121372 RepID=A0AAJ5VRT9_9HYPH|nr:hypothetical protein [Devosia sp.]WEK03626.1 MAG: hypothetical protein P0Y65_15720 [Devosia sp.]
MNTNLAMLPLSLDLVHTPNWHFGSKFAQKIGKLLPQWANAWGGLNWY